VLLHLLVMRGFSRSVDWVRAAIAVALLSALIPLNLISPLSADAAPPLPGAPASTYNCPPPGPHCYGQIAWLGTTYGTSSSIYIQPLTCGNCTTSNHYHLNVETWLIDNNSGGYIEVGYGARDAQNGAEWYFWSNTPPGQGQTRNDVGPIPPGDYFASSGFKMTRNRQDANHVQVQEWSANYRFTVVATNNMGGGYGGPNAYTGTEINIGSELVGVNNGGNEFQSTNGNADWTNNQWQEHAGTYHYQTSDGIRRIDGPEYQGDWAIPPHSSSTGGDLYVSCGC